jgi:hypothetical protein
LNDYGGCSSAIDIKLWRVQEISHLVAGNGDGF